MAPPGKALHTGKTKIFKKKPVQPNGATLGSSNVIRPTSYGNVFAANQGPKATKLAEDAKQETAKNHQRNLRVTRKGNEINGCGGPVRPTIDPEITLGLSTEGAGKNDNPTQGKGNSTTFQAHKPVREPRSFRDCIHSDIYPSNESSIQARPPNTPAKTLTTKSAGSNPLSAVGFSKWFHKVPRAASIEPASIDGDIPSLPNPLSIGRAKTYPVTQSTQRPLLERKQGATCMTGLTAGAAKSCLEAAQLTAIRGPAKASKRKKSLAGECRPVTHASGAQVDRMGSFTYYPPREQRSLAYFASVSNNSNSGPVSSQSADQDSDGGDTVKACTEVAQNAEPFPPYYEEVTQTIPTAPMIRPREPSYQPSPLLDCDPGDLAYRPRRFSESTVCVANDQSSISAAAQGTCPKTIQGRTLQEEHELTGYQRSDPSALWADQIHSAIVAPGLRHHAIDLSTDPRTDSHSARYDPHLTAGPEAPFVSIITASTSPVVPQLLSEFLAERQARIEAHGAADIWRKQHAPAVIYYYNQVVFASAAAEGDYQTKTWQMSAEYHGQRPRAETQGQVQRGGVNGRGNGRGGFGNGNGRGGRGRGGGRGGRGGPVGRGRGGRSEIGGLSVTGPSMTDSNGKSGLNGMNGPNMSGPSFSGRNMKGPSTSGLDRIGGPNFSGSIAGGSYMDDQSINGPNRMSGLNPGGSIMGGSYLNNPRINGPNRMNGSYSRDPRLGGPYMDDPSMTDPRMEGPYMGGSNGMVLGALPDCAC